MYKTVKVLIFMNVLTCNDSYESLDLISFLYPLKFTVVYLYRFNSVGLVLDGDTGCLPTQSLV